MQVNKFKIGLLSAAAVLALGVFSSCSKDFQGDIDGINSRIDKLEGLSATVDQIKKATDEGKIIKSVDKTADGIKIVVGDQTYVITNGKDGANGKDGKAGSVITIGDDGFWYIDGVKTKYAAKGEKGDKGEPGTPGKDGKDGLNGKDGKAGVYYVPGTKDAEAGFWVKVDPNTLDDKGLAKRTVTEDKWLPEGTITAEFDKGVLTLHNVKGGAGDTKSVTINPALTSLEVLPEMVYMEDEPFVVFENFENANCDCDYTAASVETISMLINEGATEEDIDDIRLIYNSPKRLVSDIRSAAIAPEVVGKPEVVDYAGLPGAKLLKVTFRIQQLKTNREVTFDRNGKIDVSLRQFYDEDDNMYTDDRVDHVIVAAKNRLGKWVFSNPIEVATQNVSTADLTPARILNKVEYDMPETLDGAKAILERLNNALPKGAVDFDQSQEYQEVVKVPYNEAFDLNDFVIHNLSAQMRMTPQELKAINIDLKYDLLNVDGKKISYEPKTNKTPQQEYIKQIDGSTFTAKVYDLDPNKSAVGRTPIVHVSYTYCVKSGSDKKDGICEADECPIEFEGAEGVQCKKDFFIPLFFAQKIEKNADTKTLQLTRDFKKVDYCEEYRDTLSTKEMNTLVYHKLDIPYTTFVKNFTLQTNTAKFNKDNGTVGIFDEVQDPENPNNTNRLVWIVSPAELYKYRGQAIKGLAVYLDPVSGDKVEVEFSATLPQVTFDASALQVQTDWNADYSAMLLNSRVPDQEKSLNPGVVTYKSYLENGFRNIKALDADPDAVQLDKAYVKKHIGLNNFRYWFGFDKEQNVLSVGNVSYKLIAKESTKAEYASGDGLRDGNVEANKTFQKTYQIRGYEGAKRVHNTELWAQKIVKGKKVGQPELIVGLAGENNSFYEINKESNLAKEILNVDSQFLRATLRLFVMDDCDHCIKVTGLNGSGDSFRVIFQRPLDLTASSKEYFINGVNKGTKFAKVDMGKNFTLTDWRINSTDAEVKKHASFADHTWYEKYYNVKVSVPEDIKSAITLRGLVDRAGKAIVKPLPTMNFKYTPAQTASSLGVLEYWNNDNSIMNEFKIVVPVTVTYEFGTIVTECEIAVKPTSIKPGE